MPLYAYIKIPGIQNSESTDEDYGSDWIPLNSLDFSNNSDGNDDEYKRTTSERERIKKIFRLKKALEKAKKENNEKNDTQMLAALKKIEENLDKPNTTKDETNFFDAGGNIRYSEYDLEEEYEPKESGGEITLTKMLDATSPKLHELCVTCQQYESDKYIEGKIEIHICRQIPLEDDSKGSREAYMAYILEKCLLTSLGIRASESSKMEETFTISFEIINSCVKLPNGQWDSEGWNFADEQPTPHTEPTPP